MTQVVSPISKLNLDMISHITTFFKMDDRITEVSKIFYMGMVENRRTLTLMSEREGEKELLRLLAPFVSNGTISPLPGTQWKNHTLINLRAIFGALDLHTKTTIQTRVRYSMDLRYKGSALRAFRFYDISGNALAFFTNFLSRSILSQIKKVNFSINAPNIVRIILRYFQNLSEVTLFLTDSGYTQEKADHLMEKLARRIPALEKLILVGNEDQVSGKGLMAVASRCARLSSLTVMDIRFDHETYAKLSQCKQIKLISLIDSEITTQGLQSLSASSSLEDFSINSSNNLEEETFILKLLEDRHCFPALKYLRTRHLWGSRDSTLQKLKAIRPNLSII